MKNDLRPFTYSAAMFVGAWVGWAGAEFSWRIHHPWGFGRHILGPTKGVDYYCIACLCVLAGMALGLAVVGFGDLPKEE